jgi:hypothetical protein
VGDFLEFELDLAQRALFADFIQRQQQGEIVFFTLATSYVPECPTKLPFFSYVVSISYGCIYKLVGCEFTKPRAL